MAFERLARGKQRVTSDDVAAACALVSKESVIGARVIQAQYFNDAVGEADAVQAIHSAVLNMAQREGWFGEDVEADEARRLTFALSALSYWEYSGSARVKGCKKCGQFGKVLDPAKGMVDCGVCAGRGWVKEVHLRQYTRLMQLKDSGVVLTRYQWDKIWHKRYIQVLDMVVLAASVAANLLVEQLQDY